MLQSLEEDWEDLETEKKENVSDKTTHFLDFCTNLDIQLIQDTEFTWISLVNVLIQESTVFLIRTSSARSLQRTQTQFSVLLWKIKSSYLVPLGCYVALQVS